MNIKALIQNPVPYLKVAKTKCVRFFRTYFYRGNIVLCENCSWKGQLFFNGKCPRCKSLPRTRLIPFSLDFFEIKRTNLKVLHVAPNKTEYLGVKAKLYKVIQYDKLDIRAVKHVNLVEDLTNLTLNNDTYDLVIIWHVFEHIVEDTKAIKEVYRVLKPKGSLLMSVPIYPIDNTKTYEDPEIPYDDFEKIHGHDDHCRSCGLDYYLRFEDFGFITNTLQVKDLDKKIISHFGLNKNHVVWCFTKPIDAV